MNRPASDVRMRGFRDRTDVADVLALLAARVAPLPAERIDLNSAAERVLAEDIVAPVAVPAFDRAAMDGFALRGAETFGAGAYNSLEFDVVGLSLPGCPFVGAVSSGQAVRIMTGAPLPAGVDAVLPAEVAEEVDGRLRVSEAVLPGRHVGRRGEDIEPGTIVLRAGRVLRPQDVGVLASLGVNPLTVVRRPRVSLVISGDELLPAGSRPEGFRIVDSNSPMLTALALRDGAIVAAPIMIPDCRDAVRDTLSSTDADLILCTGGTSVGQEDHLPIVLAELGELAVHGVALRPASPTGVGFIDNRPVILLPGNPASCLCGYDLLAGPALRRLGGRSMDLPYRSARLPLARKIASAVGRVDYVRVRIDDNGQVEPLAISGASILSSTTRADGFVLVPRNSEGHAPGEEVVCYYYD
jgi:molybdopterin molybdotransferase